MLFSICFSYFVTIKSFSSFRQKVFEKWLFIKGWKKYSKLSVPKVNPFQPVRLWRRFMTNNNEHFSNFMEEFWPFVFAQLFLISSFRVINPKCSVHGHFSTSKSDYIKLVLVTTKPSFCVLIQSQVGLLVYFWSLSHINSNITKSNKNA